MDYDIKHCHKDDTSFWLNILYTIGAHARIYREDDILQITSSLRDSINNIINGSTPLYNDTALGVDTYISVNNILYGYVMMKSLSQVFDESIVNILYVS